MLTYKENNRYLRHILLEEIGTPGQLKLKQAKVLVIGAGGLGCPALQYLVAAGVGHIGIIDHDRVEVSNLQRQILFLEKDIGKPKVVAARNRLLQMNSSVHIEVYHKKLMADNAGEIFDQYDIIVEGSDNFATKYLANDAAVITGKPLVFGSVHKFEGQISVFNFRKGPTYRCLFGDPNLDSTIPSCSTAGVLGILPGIIGNLQANEVLKIILGIGEVLTGKLLLFNALEMQIQVLPFSKNTSSVVNKLEELNFTCETSDNYQMSYKEYKKSPELFCLLDVRSALERSIGSIGGKNIPLAQLSERYGELKEMDNILVYCASGVRSEKAIAQLKKLLPGKNVYALKGGLDMIKM